MIHCNYFEDMTQSMLRTMTKAERQFLKSLHQKKYRYSHKRFLLEGEKLVKEAVDSQFPLESIFYSDTISDHTLSYVQSALRPECVLKSVSPSDINFVSSLKNPEGIIATGIIPEMQSTEIITDFSSAIYLWEINDPGNLGTILRTADWFGIQNIFLSPGCVDPFSPKVVRGSMGALFRMAIWQEIPFDFIQTIAANNHIDLITADTRGEPPDKIATTRWLLVLGSESHGLSNSILNKSNFTVGIPRIGSGESLNLAVSAGILIHELHRIKRSH